MWFNHRATHPNYADRIANTIDPDQTVRSLNTIDPDQTVRSLIWVYTVCPKLSVGKRKVFVVCTIMILSFRTDRSGQTV